MRTFRIFILILAFGNCAFAQSVKRSDSVAYLQKVADSLSIEHSSKNIDSLCHLIGSQYLKLGKDSIAARYLLRVRYDSQRKFNELGLAFSKIRRREDSAFLFFRKAADMNVANNGSKNAEYIITAKNLGDQFVSRRNLDSGVYYYQQAITYLVPEFNEEDVRLNPYEIKETDPRIYDLLLLKAVTLTRRYNDDGKVSDLVAAMNAFNTIYKLTPAPPDSITFDAVNTAVKLFEVTTDEVFLRHAFSFASYVSDVKELQKRVGNNNGVLTYNVGDTSLIGLFLTNEKILHSRITIDSTSKLVLPFENESSNKGEVFVIRDRQFPNVRFRDNTKNVHVNYVDSLSGQAFKKENNYSFLVWIMVAVVAMLAVIVVRKVK